MGQYPEPANSFYGEELLKLTIFIVQLMDTSGPHDPLHDDGASMWEQDDGHFKKKLFGPLHP